MLNKQEIKLNEVVFNREPTPSQVANVLRDQHVFLKSCVGLMLANNSLEVADPRMQQLLNTVGQLEIAQRFMDGSAMQPQQPQMAGRPVMVPRG